MLIAFILIVAFLVVINTDTKKVQVPVAIKAAQPVYQRRPDMPNMKYLEDM